MATRYRVIIKGSEVECEAAMRDRGFVRFEHVRAILFSDGEKHEYLVEMSPQREVDLEIWFAASASAVPLPPGSLTVYNMHLAEP